MPNLKKAIKIMGLFSGKDTGAKCAPKTRIKEITPMTISRFMDEYVSRVFLVRAQLMMKSSEIDFKDKLEFGLALNSDYF